MISVFGDRERLSSIVDSVFDWISSQWFLSQYCIRTSTEEPCEDRLAALW